MSFWKKLGKGLKKVLPIAAVAAPFLPGVGSAISGVLGKVGGLFGGGGGSAQSMGDPNAGPQPDRVEITDKKDPFDWGKAFQSAMPALQGAMQYFGQRDTNVANAQQAQRQMDFQAEQTGSSYQRAVADMKAAGLNPMLAYSQGGAASGGGAQATMGNELGSGASSALSAAQAIQSMKATEAQIHNINADTTNKEQQTTNLESENLYTLARTTNEGTRNHELVQRVAQIALANQLAAGTMDYSVASAKSGADLRKAEAEAADLRLPEARAWSNFYKSVVGKSYPYVSKATEQSNSAANVFRKFIPFTND